MNTVCPQPSEGRSVPAGWLVALVVPLVAVLGGGPFAEKVKAIEPGLRRYSLEPRVPVGQCATNKGLLLANMRPGKPWSSVGKGDAVHSRDLLLALPGTQASLTSQPGGVELTLWGNLPDQTSLPTWESDVVLHDSRSYDLDFTLFSGRVVLTHRKSKGTARVWVRLPGVPWELTLKTPGTRVALELYGRWPGGVPFTREAKPSQRPTQSLTVVVLQGEVSVKTPAHVHSLAAPPGPASFRWNSVEGEASGPGRLDRVPQWADPMRKPSAIDRAIDTIVAEYQARLQKESPESALLTLLGNTSGDKSIVRLRREFAILGLAALDQITRVLRVLDQSSHADARLAAVLALRHWIGTTWGRDQYVYLALTGRLGYLPKQATTVMQLLHSPFRADDPGTYQTLIAYLRHKKMAVRQLAYWHLIRLVPQGRKIEYDADGTEKSRDQAVAAWRKLIPSGSLPSEEKGTKEK